jgi:hypothetical protein
MGLAPPPKFVAEHPTLERYLPTLPDIFLRFSCEADELSLKKAQI